MKLRFGGGANILDQSHDLNNPKVFKRFNLNYFIGCSEERLLRIKRGEGLIPTAQNQQVQYTNLIKTIKSSSPRKKKNPKSGVYTILKEAKEIGNNKSYSNLHKLLPDPCPIDTIHTKRVIDCFENNGKLQEESQLNAKNWFQGQRGLIEAEKLANLKNFLIVINIKEKYSNIGIGLKENELRGSIQEGIHNFEKKASMVRQNSVQFKEELNAKHEKNPKFFTSSEKKMLQVDQEIQNELEMAARIKSKRTSENLAIIEAATKDREKSDSQVKKTPKFLPKSFVSNKSSENFNSILRKKNFRSVSSMGLSEIKSIVKNNKKKQSKNQLLIEDRSQKHKFIYKTPSLDLNDLSSQANDFIKASSKIQKSLRSAFRVKK